MGDIMGHEIISISLNRLQSYKVQYKEIKLESINRNMHCNIPSTGKQTIHF